MARETPMNPVRRISTRRLATVLSVAAAALLMVSAPASADPVPVATDYGGGCVIDPANRAARP